MVMTKKEICMTIYDKTDLPQKECKKIVDGLFEIIKDELGMGNNINISGFGKWEVLNKDARNGRNPQTGEPITIDARKVATFKASNVLRRKINSKT